MPRWWHCRFAFFLAQEALTTAATLLHRESSEGSSKSVTLRARGTDVWDDPYFIPAIASIGAFVLLSLVCLYFLGCCCNSRKMDEYYSRRDVPPRISTTTHNNRRPTINLNDGSDNFSTVSPTKTPPRTTVSPTLPSARLQQLEGPQWHNQPQMIPSSSHGFQPPTSVMSVHHLNPTSASYGYERSSQVPRSSQLIQPDATRMSSMSSASSTQIGSGGGGGEQAPYLYSPHQGNTLSYVSSNTSPSVGAAAPVWDPSTMPRMPDNFSEIPLPTQQGYHGQPQTAQSRPPAYVEDRRSVENDMKKS